MTDICHLKQLQENMILHHPPLEIGQSKVNYVSSDQEGQKDCTTKMILEQFLKVKIYKKKIKEEREFCMQELVLTIKKKILEDKSNISKKNIQGTNSLKTLVQVLTGKEKVLMPFWKESTKVLSQKLWSPTKIDCVDLELSSLNGFVKNQMLKSWFSIQLQKQKTENKNCQKIYSQLSTSLLQETMDSDLPKIEKSDLKSIKIRLRPNKEQKLKLKQWFGCYRFVYNKCIDYIKNGERSEDKTLRKLLRENIIKDKNYKNENKWMCLPADTRDYASKEAYQQYVTNLKHKHKFNLTFKNKKQSQTIDIRKRQFYVSRGKYKFLSEIKTTEKLPNLEHDIKIHMDVFENFYIIVPVKLNMSENQAPNRIISLDPGIRTFLTGYSNDGHVFHLGKNDVSRLCRLYHYRFKLQSRMDKCKKQKDKVRLKKAINKLSQKQKNLVEEAHKKISKWLLENFDIIILPKLNTNSFCKKKMNKKVKNKIKCWRHCSFIDRLNFKNLEYPSVTIICPSEEYTSKTCSGCGFLHNKLGSNKTFNCPSCLKSFDRDVNASKNILLKCLTKEVS